MIAGPPLPEGLSDALGRLKNGVAFARGRIVFLLEVVFLRIGIAAVPPRSTIAAGHRLLSKAPSPVTVPTCSDPPDQAAQDGHRRGLR